MERRAYRNRLVLVDSWFILELALESHGARWSFSVNGAGTTGHLEGKNKIEFPKAGILDDAEIESLKVVILDDADI